MVPRTFSNRTITAVAGATNSTLTIASITTSTFYYATVTCGVNIGQSTPVGVTIRPITQCYCASSANSTDDEDIFRVTLGTLNSVSNCGTTAPGPGSVRNRYSNYQSGTNAPAAPNLTAGETFPFQVQIGTCGGSYPHSTAIFIDFNQDGTYQINERAFLSAATVNGPAVISGNVIIPGNAVVGLTGMRVINVENVPGSITACGTYTWGETEDYLVNITPCIPLTLVTPPESKSAVCGSATFLSTVITGTGRIYQWQVQTTAGGPWMNLTNTGGYTGVNADTLRINPVASSMNGYNYRVVYSGGCTSVTFTPSATLTVSPLIPIVTPTSATICLGTNTIVPISIGNFGTTQTSTFSSAANLALPITETGTGTTNILPVTLPGSAQITDIKVKLNITHTWIGDMIIALRAPNGQVYNLSYALNGTDNGPGTFTNTVLSFGPNGLGVPFPLLSTGTTPFSSTFRVDGRIAATATPLDNGVDNVVRPTGPTGFTATTNIPTTFFGAAGVGTGAWTIAMYDFYDDGTNGGSINRLVNWSMDITYGSLATGIFTSTPTAPNTIFTDALATIPYDGVTPVNTVYVKPTVSTVYNVAINTGTCAASTTVSVTVNTPLAGTPTVSNVSVCAGTNAVFNYAGITAGTGLTFQWQVSTAAVPAFTNITGATSASYTVTAASAAQSGNSYRVVITAAGCAGPLTSTAGTLTVNPLPVVRIDAQPIRNLFPGLTTTLIAVVSPNPAGATYQWFRNGTAVAGATSNRLLVNIDGVGTYTVRVVDANQCVAAVSTSTPANIVIGDSANVTKLFIYPSPNNGRFQVRYFNDVINNGPNPGIINVYDSKGSRVFTKNYNVGGGFQAMNVDLGTSHGKGVYRIDLLTSNGERIKTGSVIVF